MQRAGLPKLTSLNILIEQTQGPNIKKIIIQIKKDLATGTTTKYIKTTPGRILLNNSFE